MAEQNDIDLDSVIDRLLEGESMLHSSLPLALVPVLFTRPVILPPESL